MRSNKMPQLFYIQVVKNAIAKKNLFKEALSKREIIPFFVILPESFPPTIGSLCAKQMV